MVTKYFVDMPSGDSQWTEAGHKVIEDFMEIAKDFLDKAEAGGPVHLREFGFLMEYAVHGVITGASIDRRLGVGSLGRPLGYDEDELSYISPETNFEDMAETMRNVPSEK